MRVAFAAGLCLAAGNAMTTQCLGQVDWREKFPRVADSLEVNRTIISEARLELEMRRAGGPRPATLMGVLSGPPFPDRIAWINEVLRVCNQHIVPCSELLRLFDELQGRNDPAAPALRWTDREAIRELVAYERLSSEKREELFRWALARGGARVGEVFILAGDAAFRIFDERIRDLYPEVDAVLQSNWTGDKSRVIAARRVALASAGPQPASRLNALVREVAVWDAESWSLPDPQRYRALSTGRSPRAPLVNDALRELRRLHLPGTLEGLNESMKLYEVDHVLAASGYAERRLGKGLSTSRWFSDDFGAEIAKVVGDFGDRQVEREILGGRCLWDLVHEAEVAMVAKKLLAPSQMVTEEGARELPSAASEKR